MSFFGKFSLGVVSLLIVSAPLQAQWNPNVNPFPGDERCREISVLVTDAAGVAIMGANVATENSIMQMTTDARGMVSIPCRTLENPMPIVDVTASGYQPARITLTPGRGSRYETVRLDRREQPAIKSSGSVVNINELSLDKQRQSAALQQRAQSAMADKDYDAAERALIEALQLTPSEPSIANNLGVVSLHRKDLDSAGKWFQKASDLAPFKPDILGNLGLVRFMQGQAEESYTILLRAFGQGYESNLGHYILGSVGALKGEGKEAIEHLKKVTSERFPYRDLYLSLALRKIGKTKDADSTYQSFLKRNPAPVLSASLR